MVRQRERVAFIVVLATPAIFRPTSPAKGADAAGGLSAASRNPFGGGGGNKAWRQVARACLLAQPTGA